MAGNPKGRRYVISDSTLDLLFGSKEETVYTFEGSNYVIERVPGRIYLRGIHKPKPDSTGRLGYAPFGREDLRQKYEALIGDKIIASGIEDAPQTRRRKKRKSHEGKMP